MIIYDISQEVFSCQVYPGDPAPEKRVLSSMEKGDSYNLTAFSMCAHNGTHIDAPFHFIKNGKTVDEVCLDALVGMAYVAEHQGIVSGDDAAEILKKAKEHNREAAKRILIKGDAEVSSEAAKVFASSEILLLGNESQTVGPEDEPMEVHIILLGADVILLEGIRLEGVSEGVYLLNAAPLNLSGADGSPCRALLIADVCYMREESHGTVELWTENLILRRYRTEDAEQLHRLLGTDPEMYKYSGWNPYATLEMAREAVCRFIESYGDEHSYSWVIDVDNTVVGTIGAYDYKNSRIEVGFSVAGVWQGRGIATEALKKVLEYLTGNEGISSVIAWCADENVCSRRVLEKSGMQFVRTEKEGLTVGDRSYDKLIYEYKK